MACSLLSASNTQIVPNVSVGPHQGKAQVEQHIFLNVRIVLPLDFLFGGLGLSGII